MIARRPLTAAVIEKLETVFDDVGHSRAPVNAGWQGEPNAEGSNFKPYVVVTPMTASQSSGPFSDPSADRQIPYSIAAYGVTPEQVEWAADRAREVVETMKKDVIELETGVDYKVSKVATDVIGMVQRVEAMDPPYFGQVDQIVVWLAKRTA